MPGISLVIVVLLVFFYFALSTRIKAGEFGLVTKNGEIAGFLTKVGWHFLPLYHVEIHKTTDIVEIKISPKELIPTIVTVSYKYNLINIYTLAEILKNYHSLDHGVKEMIVTAINYALNHPDIAMVLSKKKLKKSDLEELNVVFATEIPKQLKEILLLKGVGKNDLDVVEIEHAFAAFAGAVVIA